MNRISRVDLRSDGPATPRGPAIAALLLALLAAPPGVAQAAGYAGLPLDQALQRLVALGLEVVYSSALVDPAMRVGSEPTATEPRAILEQILAPFGLVAVDGPEGVVLLTRRTETQAAPPPSAPVVLPLPTELAEVVVSASHYQFSLATGAAVTSLTAGEIELLPEIGGDPVRAVARLPGVARQDFSSRPHIRGGAEDETLVRFDGLRLYNPYHLKDFHTLFSTIDPRMVERLSVYSAGFPASYGDRMSGVIDVTPFRPDRPLQGSLHASFFNVGGLLAGRLDQGRTDWLVSARRGTLDFVLKNAAPRLGRPKYMDFHAHLGHRFDSGLALSGNALLATDDLTLFDSDQEEQARAEYRDRYYWLKAELGDPGRRGATLLLSQSRLHSERAGSADLPGVARGSLAERRGFRIDTLQADGWWPLGERRLLQAGAEWRRMSGRYDYADEAEFDLLFLIPGAPTEVARSRALSLRPHGEQYGAYLNLRLSPLAPLTADLGLRWDRETLSRADSARLSPRVGVLWEFDGATRLRAGWGRFFQAQGIDELPVSDGETRYRAAQRADHLVASVERSLGSGWELRVEAYRKRYDRLRPRYENLFDTLVVLPELKPDRAVLMPRRAVAEGVEVSVDYAGSEGRGGWLRYSWSSAQDRLHDQDVRRGWDQTHAISAGYSRVGERWEWSLAATWHSGWPTTAIELATLEPIPLVAAGRRNAREIGPYARLDARIARRFDLGPDNRLTLFLEISNLTHRRSDCCVEYEIEAEDDEPVLDVATRETLPLVPTLGFSWDF